MYKVVVTARAMRDLERMDKETRQRVIDKLGLYAHDPMRHARKLTSPKIGTWRFRIGEYRVIFDLEGDTIVVLRLGHRREVYGGN